MSPATPAWTWATLSRTVGLTIVLVLLVAFLIGFFAHIELDRTLTLAFLGIASGLIGLPSGWQLVRRNGEGSK